MRPSVLNASCCIFVTDFYFCPHWYLLIFMKEVSCKVDYKFDKLNGNSI